MHTMPVQERMPNTDASACDLARTLLRVAHMVEAQLEAALEQVGMSLAKLSVLRHLVRAGESLPLSQLAERSSCVRSNMTQLVDRLEADGLVRRIADPNDRRSVRATLTRAGQRRYDQAAQLLAAREQEIAAALGGADCAQLNRLLGLLIGDR